MWCGYQKLGDCFYLTMFVDSSLMSWFYFPLNDVTLGLCMLSFRSLLTFCYRTYWPLIIDVYTLCLVEDKCIRVHTSIISGQYLLSRKINKHLNDNIHRPNVTSLRENETTASKKNPQI
jgi:hypothetical protein